jgi:hypothetical protein
VFSKKWREKVNESRELVNREDCAVLANISDQEFFSNQATLGSYTVPARAAGEPYSLLSLFGRREMYDMGDDRKGEKYWTAKEIAQSVLAEHNPDADLRRFGVFLCAGAHPTEQELTAAQARQDSFYLEQIHQADITYSRTPQRPDSITDVQRRAARALGIDRPWLVKLAAMSECPACGGTVKAGAAICRHCGMIMDEEKAAKFGIVRRAGTKERSNEGASAGYEIEPAGATVDAASRAGKKK